MMWRWWQKVCIFMSLGIFTASCSNECQSESKFLIQFIKSVDPKNKLNNKYKHVPDCFSNPWPGIKCDASSLCITDIRLENKSLSGNIDAVSLCKLKNLQILNLASNNVHGVVPEAISSCINLTYLNLSNTMLHGNMPTSLSRLKKLRVLDISLTNLTVSVLGLLSSSENDTAKIISNNNGRTNSGEKTPDIKWTVKLIVPFLPLLLLLFFYYIFAYMTYKNVPKLSTEKEFAKQSSESSVKIVVVSTEESSKSIEETNLAFFKENCTKFCIEELLKSAADLQGQNFYSTLYKVKMHNTSLYAVKRLKNFQITKDEFKAEFTRIGNLRHPNLLPLCAVNSSEKEKFLIYGFHTNGSLAALLSSYVKKQIEFPWRERLSIMSGVARGLEFIAKEPSEKNPAHGNLKPSNIILSDTNEPLISEYGIWGFLDKPQAFLYSSIGYRAPEKRITKEADVYSFGVILLELLTGKNGNLNLPKWVKSMVREEWTGEVLDKVVRIEGNKYAFSLLNIALKCVSDLPERRPSISVVLEKIEHVIHSQESYSFSSTSSDGSD